MRIDGREHTRDVIVLPDRVIADWWRRDGHSLAIEDLADVLTSCRGIWSSGAAPKVG